MMAGTRSAAGSLAGVPGAAAPVAGGSGAAAAVAGVPAAAIAAGASAPVARAGAGTDSRAGADAGVASAGAGIANAGAGASSPAGAAAAASAPVAIALSKDGETLLTERGLRVVSYGGYLNGESFQQEGILSFNGYQYSAYWNSARHVVLARRKLPAGTWSEIELSDYTNREDDAHNTIALGISPADGVLHLAFDHHSSELHYRSSAPGLLTQPDSAPWAAASFSAVSNRLDGAAAITQVTYPRFVTEPSGEKLLLEARIGTSGSGDEYLWEYDAKTRVWTALGKYIDGIRDSTNAYLHGLTYGASGTRLHAAWCWRESSDAATNHDLVYVYSDDHGRSWKSEAGMAVATTGRTAITKSTPGITAVAIRQARGLINQEHMVVDAAGRVHVLLSHMPDERPDEPNFDAARSRSQFFHYLRDTAGRWQRRATGLSVVANFRGKFALASSGNLYAILPDLRIAGASAADEFTKWTVISASSESGRFFSDPLVDTARLQHEDVLTVVYPLKNSPNISVLDFSVR